MCLLYCFAEIFLTSADIADGRIQTLGRYYPRTVKYRCEKDSSNQRVITPIILAMAESLTEYSLSNDFNATKICYFAGLMESNILDI